MDDKEFEDEDEGVAVYSRKVNRADLFVLGFDLCRGVSDAFSCLFQMAGTLAAGHSNFYTDQNRFHEQAALEIESLIAGEESDG